VPVNGGVTPEQTFSADNAGFNCLFRNYEF
jgi:hypothetical protein